MDGEGGECEQKRQKWKGSPIHSQRKMNEKNHGEGRKLIHRFLETFRVPIKNFIPQTLDNFH